MKYYCDTLGLQDLKKRIIELAHGAGCKIGFCHPNNYKKIDESVKFSNSFYCFETDENKRIIDCGHSNEDCLKDGGWVKISIDQAIELLSYKKIQVREGVTLDKDNIYIYENKFPISLIDELIDAQERINI